MEKNKHFPFNTDSMIFEHVCNGNIKGAHNFMKKKKQQMNR